MSRHSAVLCSLLACLLAPNVVVATAEGQEITEKGAGKDPKQKDPKQKDPKQKDPKQKDPKDPNPCSESEEADSPACVALREAEKAGAQVQRAVFATERLKQTADDLQDLPRKAVTPVAHEQLETVKIEFERGKETANSSIEETQLEIAQAREASTSSKQQEILSKAEKLLNTAKKELDDAVVEAQSKFKSVSKFEKIHRSNQAFDQLTRQKLAVEMAVGATLNRVTVKEGEEPPKRNSRPAAALYARFAIGPRFKAFVPALEVTYARHANPKDHLTEGNSWSDWRLGLLAKFDVDCGRRCLFTPGVFGGFGATERGSYEYKTEPPPSSDEEPPREPFPRRNSIYGGVSLSLARTLVQRRDDYAKQQRLAILERKSAGYQLACGDSDQDAKDDVCKRYWAEVLQAHQATKAQGDCLEPTPPKTPPSTQDEVLKQSNALLDYAQCRQDSVNSMHVYPVGLELRGGGLASEYVDLFFVGLGVVGRF